LVAAQVISALRREPHTASLTVRDLYEARTVAGLAARVPPLMPRTARPSEDASALQREGSAPRRAPDAARVSPHAGWGVAIQCGFLAVALVAVVNTAWFLASRVVPLLTRSIGITAFVLLLPSLVLVVPLLWTLVAPALTLIPT